MITTGSDSIMQTTTLTAGAEKTGTDHKLGCFTQQINNHKVYRYDIYGGKKFGPFYPSARLIKTERQILCPFEIATRLAKPIQIICGSAYHLPSEFERFDPQYGNFDLRPEHNYHCHIIHNWENPRWTIEQILFVNHITDIIEFSGFNKPYQNRGTLNSIGIDQSIGYNGFNHYKIGCAHTYCVLDGSKPVLNRPAWKFLLWQRLYLSENCFVDLRANLTGTYLSTDRLAWEEKHVKMPGVFLLDAGITRVLNKNWTILCEIKNLTNHHYESPHGFLVKGIEAWVRLVYTI
jgi:outer membrane cobalamin receptor